MVDTNVAETVINCVVEEAPRESLTTVASTGSGSSQLGSNHAGPHAEEPFVCVTTKNKAVMIKRIMKKILNVMIYLI